MCCRSLGQCPTLGPLSLWLSQRRSRTQQLHPTFDKEIGEGGAVWDKLCPDSFRLKSISPLRIRLRGSGVCERTLHCSSCKQRVLHRGKDADGREELASASTSTAARVSLYIVTVRAKHSIREHMHVYCQDSAHVYERTEIWMYFGLSRALAI